MNTKITKSFFEKARPHGSNEVLKKEIVKIDWPKEVRNGESKVKYGLTNNNTKNRG